MKVYVIGASGSGKSTYAKSMSHECAVPHFDLDDVKWLNDNGKHYIKSRTYPERAQLIAEIIKKNKYWIFEGVYYADWMDQIFKQADEVIILQTPKWLCQWRCLRRAIKRYNPKNTSIRTIYDLLRWNREYYSKYLPQALEKMRKIGVKYRFIKR